MATVDQVTDYFNKLSDTGKGDLPVYMLDDDVPRDVTEYVSMENALLDIDEKLIDEAING